MKTTVNPNAPAEVKAEGRLRRPVVTDDFKLTAEAETWLTSIEASVRPQHITVAFPRVVNQIARLWNRPAEMDQYFAGLLMDLRGDRTGFLLQMFSELSALKEYYRTKAFPGERIVEDPFQDPERYR